MSKQINRTTFHRASKDFNYTMMDNGFLRRDDLSWRAKGILAYVLMLPDDWQISLEEVARHATEGIHSFRKGWAELEEKGYIKRYPIREGRYISHWQTEIYERPQLAPAHASAAVVPFPEMPPLPRYDAQEAAGLPPVPLTKWLHRD